MCWSLIKAPLQLLVHFSLDWFSFTCSSSFPQFLLYQPKLTSRTAGTSVFFVLQYCWKHLQSWSSFFFRNRKPYKIFSFFHLLIPVKGHGVSCGPSQQSMGEGGVITLTLTCPWRNTNRQKKKHWQNSHSHLESIVVINTYNMSVSVLSHPIISYIEGTWTA